MDKKKRYLELLIEKQLSFDKISEELKIDRKMVSEWYEELRPERESLAKVRTIWLNKELQNIPLMEFNEWYTTNRECYYCGITEDKIAILFDKKAIYTKRNRGKKLEIDRKMPEKEYKEGIENLVHSCYWCNNGKTDTFTSAEFKEIGKVISVIWEKRLEKC